MKNFLAMVKSCIYTIGHGNKSIEELVTILRSYGIKYLIDVRSKPYSKYYPQFNREDLAVSINNTGDIVYGYMGDQIGGLPPDDRYKTNGKMDYNKMKTNPNYQIGLSRIIKANNLGFPTCLMCSESNPAECHRSKLLGESLRENGIIINHIVKNKLGKYVLKSQKDVINEVANEGVEDLFGESLCLMSRNTY